MPPAAQRFALLALLLPALAAAVEPAGRSAPTRPAGSGSAAATAPAQPPAAPKVRLSSLSVTRIAGADYISIREAAALLGFRTTWQEKERRLTLADATSRVEFTTDSREAALNGTRLFFGRPVAERSGVLYLSKIDFERLLVARLRPALVPAPPPRPRVIALDPGHGGADNGFENKPLKLKEKVLTLDVAQRLQKLLTARGYKVVLTRNDDRQLGPDKTTDFRMRADLANRAGADLFVSIHFNSLFPDSKTGGTEVYTFTPRFQRSDRAWSPAEQDDAEDVAAPVNRYDPWSGLLSQMIHREVISQLKTADRGQKTMHSAVLRGLDCPAVLVESIFLSSDKDVKQAASPAGRQQIAAAISAGIEAYADALAALQPKPAAPGGVTPP